MVTARYLSCPCSRGDSGVKSARRVLMMNKKADRAQIESDEVASDKVLSTGDNATKAKNTRMADLAAFVPTSKGWI